MTHYRLWPALTTHRGQRRPHNEDSIAYVYPDNLHVLREYGALFVLADGVGGLNKGEHYSQQGVKSICELYYQTPANNVGERLTRVLRTVNSQLYELGEGGASTIVAAVFHGDSVTIANAGDSPAYVITPQSILKLTIDHLVDDPNTPKKRLFRALGYESALTVDCITGTVVPGMRILLCSDGLTRYFTDEQLGSNSQPHNTKDTIQMLVHEAYLRGGSDNISAVMIEVADKLTDETGLRQHIGRIQPILTLPDQLSNVHPLFPPYMKPYSVGETTGSILTAAYRKSYLRDQALPPVTAPAPVVPTYNTQGVEEAGIPVPSWRPRFLEWLSRRPDQPASSSRTDLKGNVRRGIRDTDHD